VLNKVKKPKKCLSAYMIFVRDMRPKVCKENPDIKVLDVMKIVGKRWKELKNKSEFED